GGERDGGGDRRQSRSVPPDDDLPPLREVLSAYGISPRRSLGQNFIFDLNLTRRIAREAQISGCTVYEVGPGPGGLTRALLELGAARVIAVERDRRAIPALEQIAAARHGQLDIVEADALSVRERQLLSDLGARPCDAAYGRLAVLTQWRSTARILFNVSRQAFIPPPNVTAAVLRVDPLPAAKYPAELADLEKVTAAAFGQRRKMLRSSLKTLTAESDRLLEAAEIIPTGRAEELTVEQFCALARAYRNLVARKAV